MKKRFTGQATYEHLCVEARARKFLSRSDYIEKLFKHLQLLFNLGCAFASRRRTIQSTPPVYLRSGLAECSASHASLTAVGARCHLSRHFGQFD
jgi:hypothetical protein